MDISIGDLVTIGTVVFAAGTYITTTNVKLNKIYKGLSILKAEFGLKLEKELSDLDAKVDTRITRIEKQIDELELVGAIVKERLITVDKMRQDKLKKLNDELHSVPEG
jgi:hypothetical protein